MKEYSVKIDRVKYSKFKHNVIINAGYQCEVPGCDAVEHLTVHHFLPRSTYPEYIYDSDNGMCVCGSDHSLIEARIRKRDGSEIEMYPEDRYQHMKEKAGV